MAYGNLITDGAQVAVGTNGYIVSFDLRSVLMQQLIWVRLSKSNVLSFENAVPYTVGALLGLAESDNPPDVAFAQQGTFALAFVNSSKYPYDASTRIAFGMYQSPRAPSSTNSLLDFPPKSKDLVKCIRLRNLFQSQGRFVPYAIQEQIAFQRKLLDI